MIALLAVFGLSRSGLARVGLGIYPEIVSFTASPGTLHSGEAVTLTWVARGADAVTLEWGPENAPPDRIERLAALPPMGSLRVEPKETTVYELTCETDTIGQACAPMRVIAKVN